MNYKRLSVQKRLISSKEAILTVLEDPSLSERLAGKGYPAEELAVGLSLQDEALKLYQTRIVEYGTGVVSTETLNELSKSVRSFAVSHRNIARRALQDSPGLLDKLRLRQTLSVQRDVMLMQIRHFYTEIFGLPEVLEEVAPYGIMANVVEARLADVDALEAAMKEQQQRRAEAQELTVKRNQAIADLDNWTVEFLGTVRLTFRNQREQLNKLGF